MKAVRFCNKIIEISFYAILFFVPLIFTGNTSELFEFNKMWITFGITLIMAAAWFSKMIIQKRVLIQKTPLDIPIALFLLSQIVSTIFSLDPHISWWGYYSRFNGGLLSTLTYIFLYYAFVTNMSLLNVVKSITVTLISGAIVILWGLPAHFGYDPTCLVFRGTLDTSCWTDAFKPTIRIFSTLGQPAWMAAYLLILLPLTVTYGLIKLKTGESKKMPIILFIFSILTYLSLVFTNTRAGVIGLAVVDIVLWGFIFYKKVFEKNIFLRYLLIFHVGLLISSFVFGAPLANFNKFTLAGIMTQSQTQTPKQEQPASPVPALPPKGDTGITDSGDIRLLVWKGAIEAWRNNPIFGTGVETFAFAYYRYKSPEHNMTSEWDYLYNKAHNEYLNYLSTTGLVGLGTYLSFIGLFIFYAVKLILKKGHEHDTLLIIALFAGWLSILVTNFFGFSVVIMNIYLFLIPAFIFILGKALDSEKVFIFGASEKNTSNYINPYQWTFILVIAILTAWMGLLLIRFWIADTAYALGNNLDKVDDYQHAYPKLVEAVNAVSNEPVFKDEIALNLSALAGALYLQKDTKTATEFARQALVIDDEVIASHPNNIVFWKNRVRVLYTLGQGDTQNQGQYLTEALKAIVKAQELSPNDAKISYNAGVLYGQTGDIKKGIETLENTIKLKPNYRDAYYALGLFYHQAAIDKDNKVINPEMEKKAVEKYRYILENLSPQDKQVLDSLESWGEKIK